MKPFLKTLIRGLFLGAGLLLAAPAFADDTLDRGVGSEWSSLDPHVNFDAAAAWILADAYEGLINFSANGSVIQGTNQTAL